LAGAPDDRVGGGDDGDLAHAGAVRCQVERREAPGERVVEVVDQPGLAASAQDRVAQTRLRERGAETPMRGRMSAVCLLLERDLRTRVAHREHAEQHTDGDN